MMTQALNTKMIEYIVNDFGKTNKDTWDTAYRIYITTNPVGV